MACATCHKTRASIFSALHFLDEDRKTVVMLHDYTYAAEARVNIKYIAGETYRKVPSVVAASIVAAQAGRVIDDA